MQIYLDHQQRLNLIALMGMQKGTVAEIRKFWKLQDTLELTEKEKLDIEYETVLNDGMEMARWNTTKQVGSKSYDISENDIAIIKRVVESFPDFQARDRRWIEPLLMQLEEPELAEVKKKAADGPR